MDGDNNGANSAGGSTPLVVKLTQEERELKRRWSILSILILGILSILPSWVLGRFFKDRETTFPNSSSSSSSSSSKICSNPNHWMRKRQRKSSQVLHPLLLLLLLLLLLVLVVPQ